MTFDGGIEIVTDRVAIARLAAVAEGGFGDLVKAVVDVGRGVMAIGGELHSDEEELLIDDGSAQRDLWGITSLPRRVRGARLDRVRLDDQRAAGPGQPVTGCGGRGRPSPYRRDRESPGGNR